MSARRSTPSSRTFSEGRRAIQKLSKDLRTVLTHPEVAGALTGKKRYPNYGCAFVYRQVIRKGTQSFDYSGLCVYREEVETRYSKELRCDGCGKIVGRLTAFTASIVSYAFRRPARLHCRLAMHDLHLGPLSLAHTTSPARLSPARRCQRPCPPDCASASRLLHPSGLHRLL